MTNMILGINKLKPSYNWNPVSSKFKQSLNLKTNRNWAFLIRNFNFLWVLLLLSMPIIQIYTTLTTDDRHLYTYLYIIIIFYWTFSKKKKYFIIIKYKGLPVLKYTIRCQEQWDKDIYIYIYNIKHARITNMVFCRSRTRQRIMTKDGAGAAVLCAWV